MKLAFHPHALKRIEQRFGFEDQPIPALQMAAVAKSTPIGNRFKVHFKGITFVCVRDSITSVLVITVFPDRTTKNAQRRIKKQSKKEARRNLKRTTKNRKHGGQYK
jgi:hypothetical protein